MRKAILISMLMLIVVLCAAGAYATSYQVVQSSGLYSLSDGDTQIWDVAGFNPALGTLTSVSIDLSTTVDESWSLDNTGNRLVYTNGNTYAYGIAWFNTANYGVSYLSGAQVSDNWNTTIPKKSSIGNILHGEDSQHLSLDNSYDLSEFYNPSQVAFFNYSYFYSRNFPGNVSDDHTISSTGQAMVTYNYQPVPEPSSLLVLVAGGAGMFGFIKRRRA